MKKYIDYLIDNKQLEKENKELAYEYLSENARVETFGVDADESGLLKFIKKNK